MLLRGVFQQLHCSQVNIFTVRTPKKKNPMDLYFSKEGHRDADMYG